MGQTDSTHVQEVSEKEQVEHFCKTINGTLYYEVVDPTFMAVATVDGNIYKGDKYFTKKSAKKSAAVNALQSILKEDRKGSKIGKRPGKRNMKLKDWMYNNISYIVTKKARYWSLYLHVPQNTEWSTLLQDVKIFGPSGMSKHYSYNHVCVSMFSRLQCAIIANSIPELYRELTQIVASYL
jgi:hypothetical protein